MFSNKLIIVISLLLLIASAYCSVTLPISEKGIPFTAQSLVVFYIAGMMSSRYTLIIISSYLILGIVGLPVFAEGASGWGSLSGASGGFLYGFLLSGLVISNLINRLKVKLLLPVTGIMLLGTLVLFIFGLSHLTYSFGWEKALEYGLYPFWRMALVKAILAAVLVWLSFNLFKKSS